MTWIRKRTKPRCTISSTSNYMKNERFGRKNLKRSFFVFSVLMDFRFVFFTFDDLIHCLYVFCDHCAFGFFDENISARYDVGRHYPDIADEKRRFADFVCGAGGNDVFSLYAFWQSD